MKYQIQKGTYGYLQQKKIRVLIITIIYFAVSLSLFFAGVITTGTKKNLLTIVAVLGMLPASRSLVSFIMYAKAKGCSSDLMEEVAPFSEKLNGIYDMYFTSYKKNYAISHMVIDGRTILGVTEDPKCDVKACEEHILEQLKQAGQKEASIKIFDQTSKYLERVRQLSELSHENGEKSASICALLYEISL